MVSTLKIDQLEKANGSPVELTGQSAAKTYIHLNGTGTIAIRESFNISSVVDHGTGSYQGNLTNGMAGTEFAYLAGYNTTNGSIANVGTGENLTARTASLIRFEAAYLNSNTVVDNGNAVFALLGGLA